MKKLLIPLAALLLCAAASAQPGPMQRPYDPHQPPGMVQRPIAHKQMQHHRRKVWVPSHREHGRFIKGHYVWR